MKGRCLLYFKDEFHEKNYKELEKLKEGGQDNERLSSIYVLAALPNWFLTKTEFITESRLDVVPLIENSFAKNLSSGEKLILNLGFVLFHGDYGKNILLNDYIGYNNPLRELFIQAIQMNMPKK